MIPIFLITTLLLSLNENTYVYGSNRSRKKNTARTTAKENILSHQIDQLDQDDPYEYEDEDEDVKEMNPKHLKKTYPSELNHIKSIPFQSSTTLQTSNTRLAYATELKHIRDQIEAKEKQIQKENVWLQQGIEKISTFHSKLETLQNSIGIHEQQKNILLQKRAKIRDYIKKSLENKLSITMSNMDKVTHKKNDYNQKESQFKDTILSLQKALSAFHDREGIYDEEDLDYDENAYN